MTITRDIAAQKIGDYLHHRASLAQIVDWAEGAMMEADFQSAAVRDAVARIGLADVRAFGLTWEDCERLLRNLGFDAQINIAAAG